jgi:hypothetical protein
LAGALWTSYDVLFPAIWVEAMKKPSRARGKPAKAGPRKASKLKRNIVRKAAAHRNSAMQQIAGRLDHLGLSEYAERFGKLIGNLFDLQARGEGPQGHRRSCESVGRLATRLSRKPLRGHVRPHQVDRFGKNSLAILVLLRGTLPVA